MGTSERSKSAFARTDAEESSMWRLRLFALCGRVYFRRDGETKQKECRAATMQQAGKKWTNLELLLRRWLEAQHELREIRI